MAVSEVTVVEARFSIAGEIILRCFPWHGSTLPVEGVASLEGSRVCWRLWGD